MGEVKAPETGGAWWEAGTTERVSARRKIVDAQLVTKKWRAGVRKILNGYYSVVAPVLALPPFPPGWANAALAKIKAPRREAGGGF